MRKQIAVIGLGRLGAALSSTLSGLGHDVLAIDTDEKKVQNVASQVTHAVQADATNEMALRELGIGNFDIAIITIGGGIEASVLATILLRRLGVRYLIARAADDLHGAILEKIGADKVFYPEREMGIGMAHVLTLGAVIDYIPVSDAYGVVKLTAPPGFIGRTLSELALGSRGKWKVAVLLILRREAVIITPSDGETVKGDDALVLAGNWDSLEELFNEVQKLQASQPT